MAVIYSEHLRLEGEAVKCLEQALQISPNDTAAMFNLATLYEEEGNKTKAAHYYQDILRLEPNHHSALVRLTEAQRVVDSNALIIKQLQSALSATPIETHIIVSLNFALGKVFDDCGDYEQAFKHYKKGNELGRSVSDKYSRTEHEQWVQDNICFFTKQWFADIAPVSEAKPVFIGGMFRSGSTLIEQVLASHSCVTAGGERDFFIRQAGEGALQSYPSGVGNLTSSNLTVLANQYLEDLAKAFPDAGLITDKRPDNFLCLGLIKTLFPNAKIIHSKRNRLDNCLSVYFLRADTSVKYATDLLDTDHYYTQYERLMSHWESVFGDDVYRVDYDCLVADSEREVRGLLNFLELPWESECLEFHRLKNRVKTAGIWQIRQPLYTSSSGRWENYEASIAELIESVKSTS